MTYLQLIPDELFRLNYLLATFYPYGVTLFFSTSQDCFKDEKNNATHGKTLRGMSP